MKKLFARSYENNGRLKRVLRERGGRVKRGRERETKRQRKIVRERERHSCCVRV